ncbi:uncharacterized protein GLRG_09341 [Colletotrichum graminicola M1.001]|uniref:Uncharacterized protein n=1 Tax=Colletotrichum graminicola (strain M1.001 / M2 / FGSC 10212) TaxID=645133 RepID=E3QTK9_COLGM|nr:uncharacterized protein GLRG_09341 [Colletotrichum graminicola M1.001]EFQ34197.1 hypothetical protein GLRG_09341 [Colletotrichum graminicola M1.001]
MALTPRMDPYARLLFRLYEALVLLSILRPVNGSHLITQLSSYTIQDARRRFLKNLCFLCDYKKGGGSTTAIAVEEREDCHVFWVSSNEGPGGGITRHISDVLDHVQRFASHSEDRVTSEEALLVMCTAFASLRIRQLIRILRNAARKCRVSLEGAQKEHNDGIMNWLRSFEDNNSSELSMCRAAYCARNDEELRQIEQFGQESEETPDVMQTLPAFRAVKHMIGRLAAYIRAVSQLLDDGSRLRKLLMDYRIVYSVQCPASAAVPEADPHTTLSGVLKRLLPNQDIRYPQYLRFLADLDKQVHLESRLHREFEPGKLEPGVHAEVQLLHHFYSEKRQFAAKDRYIACSKPACICCELYFRHHPAKVCLLDSHRKVYPNWGILSLEGGAENPHWLEYRRTINGVVGDLKFMVLDQISELQILSCERQDTLTQITTSQGSVDGDSDSEMDTFGNFGKIETPVNRK